MVTRYLCDKDGVTAEGRKGGDVKQKEFNKEGRERVMLQRVQQYILQCVYVCVKDCALVLVE